MPGMPRVSLFRKDNIPGVDTPRIIHMPWGAVLGTVIMVDSSVPTLIL